MTSPVFMGMDMCAESPPQMEISWRSWDKDARQHIRYHISPFYDAFAVCIRSHILWCSLEPDPKIFHCGQTKTCPRITCTASQITYQDGQGDRLVWKRDQYGRSPKTKDAKDLYIPTKVRFTSLPRGIIGSFGSTRLGGTIGSFHEGKTSMVICRPPLQIGTMQKGSFFHSMPIVEQLLFAMEDWRGRIWGLAGKLQFGSAIQYNTLELQFLSNVRNKLSPVDDIKLELPKS